MSGKRARRTRWRLASGSSLALLASAATASGLILAGLAAIHA